MDKNYWLGRKRPVFVATRTPFMLPLREPATGGERIALKIPTRPDRPRRRPDREEPE